MNITQKTLLAAVIGLAATTSVQAANFVITKSAPVVTTPVSIDFPPYEASLIAISAHRPIYNNPTPKKPPAFDKWFLDTFTGLHQLKNGTKKCVKIISASLELELKTKDAGALWRWYDATHKDAGDSVTQYGVNANGTQYFTAELAGNDAVNGSNSIEWSTLGNVIVPLPVSAVFQPAGILTTGSITSLNGTTASYDITPGGVAVMEATNRFSFGVIEDSDVVQAKLNLSCNIK